MGRGRETGTVFGLTGAIRGSGLWEGGWEKGTGTVFGPTGPEGGMERISLWPDRVTRGSGWAVF